MLLPHPVVLLKSPTAVTAKGIAFFKQGCHDSLVSTVPDLQDTQGKIKGRIRDTSVQNFGMWLRSGRTDRHLCIRAAHISPLSAHSGAHWTMLAWLRGGGHLAPAKREDWAMPVSQCKNIQLPFSH